MLELRTLNYFTDVSSYISGDYKQKLVKTVYFKTRVRNGSRLTPPPPISSAHRARVSFAAIFYLRRGVECRSRAHRHV